MSARPTTAVVGLGLIGGSIARDLAAHGHRVLAHDADPGTVRRAVEEGVVEALARIEDADIVVLAVPVDAATGLLRTLAPRLGGARLVTDVGSTKGAIVAAAHALGLGERFVGSHPLAGDHRSGWDAARAGLFDGARTFLCPTPQSTEAALDEAHAMWTLCGARPEHIDAHAHDELLAWTSHLPQLASTALALALDHAGLGPTELGPGGRAMVRLAASSPGMWTGIAIQNAAALAGALDRLETELAAIRAALAAGDGAMLTQRFERARRWTERHR